MGCDSRVLKLHHLRVRINFSNSKEFFYIELHNLVSTPSLLADTYVRNQLKRGGDVRSLLTCHGPSSSDHINRTHDASSVKVPLTYK